MTARFTALWLSYVFAVVILWMNTGEVVLVLFWSQLVNGGHFLLFPALISLESLVIVLFVGHRLLIYSANGIGTTTQIVG